LALRLLLDHALATARRLFPASEPNRIARENRDRAVRSTTGTTPFHSDHGQFIGLLASRGLNEVTIRPGDGRDRGYPGAVPQRQDGKNPYFSATERGFQLPGQSARRRKGKSAGASRQTPRRITDEAERIAPRRSPPLTIRIAAPAESQGIVQTAVAGRGAIRSDKMAANSVAANLPLAACPCVGHIGLNGAVAEWLKAAVC
jgi:hypothetical protein